MVLLLYSGGFIHFSFFLFFLCGGNWDRALVLCLFMLFRRIWYPYCLMYSLPVPGWPIGWLRSLNYRLLLYTLQLLLISI